MESVPYRLLLLLTLGCGAQPLGQKDGDDDTGSGGSTVVTFGGVEVQPSSFEFGDVELGSTASGTWVVDNESEDAVTITTAFVEGTGYFLGDGLSFPIELAAGGLTPGSVTFTPPAEGAFSGKLSIGIEGEAGYAEVVLRGRGVSGGSGSDTATPSGAGILSTFPEAVDFGAVGLAETAWRTLQVRNTGDADVLITRLTSSNTFVFQVEPAFSVPYLLGPGQAQNVNLGFSPYELIDYDAILDIDADVEGGGILVPLSGSGGDSSCTICAPIISVSTSSGGSDGLSLSPPSGMGCTANGAVVVNNVGDMPLIITDVILNNDSISTCGEFIHSWAGEATLSPGESTTIGVDYIATSACMESSYPSTDQNMLHIVSNDTDTPDKAITLDATALYCGG